MSETKKSEEKRNQKKIVLKNLKIEIKNPKKEIPHEKSKLEEEIKEEDSKKEKINNKKIEDIPVQNVQLETNVKVSLEKVASSGIQRIPFFGRGASRNEDFSNQDNKKNDSEYISGQQEKDNPKYQHYEGEVQTRMKRPEEINLSWQNRLKETEVGFMPSESAGFGKDVHYETYVSPKRFEPEEFSKEKKKGRTAEKKEMDYHLNR